MSNRIFVCLAIFCFFNVNIFIFCLFSSEFSTNRLTNRWFLQAVIAFRLPREIEEVVNTTATPSFTEADVERVKADLARVSPPAEVEKVGNILLKLTDGKSEQEKLQGFVCEHIFGICLVSVANNHFYSFRHITVGVACYSSRWCVEQSHRWT